VSRLTETVIRAGMRRGWRSGVVEGNRVWVVVGGAALLSHLAGRAMGRQVQTVLRQDLNPGDSLNITHLLEP
jgi:hypothetical protein